MKPETYLQKSRWWFLFLLTGWADMPRWWGEYGYAWKSATYSLIEFIFLVLSPLLAIAAPVLALIQHIRDRRVDGGGK